MGGPKVFEKTKADKNVLSNLKNAVGLDGNLMKRRHSADGISSQGKLRKGVMGS